LDRILPPLPAPGPLGWNLQPQLFHDPNHLAQVMVPYDLFGAYPRILSRAQAMTVPAVARGRHLTCGTIAGLPLVALTGDTPVPVQPGWAQATDGQTGTLTAEQSHRLGIAPQSPWSRLLWTVDDLVFYPNSLWAVTALDVEGRPARMARVAYESWDIDADTGDVTDADGRPFDIPCVLIEGPHEGILTFGSETIAAADDLESTATTVARTPFRLELHQTTGAELSPDEQAALIASAKAALAANDGVLYSNEALQIITHPVDSGDLLIAGRNAAALDIARHLSMPAAMIDATSEGASLEYSTLTGRNQHWLDYGLSLYMDAITARLSMDDVVPRGQRVALDATALTALDAPPTGAPRQD
jgi:hypothetical protein